MLYKDCINGFKPLYILNYSGTHLYRQVNESIFSLRSQWQLSVFYCYFFPFVVRKVRDSGARKLNWPRTKPPPPPTPKYKIHQKTARYTGQSILAHSRRSDRIAQNKKERENNNNNNSAMSSNSNNDNIIEIVIKKKRKSERKRH